MPISHKSSSSPLGLTTYSDDNSSTKIGSYAPISSSSGIKSIFSSGSRGNNTFVNGHTDDSKISIEDIIEYTSTLPSMKLSYADFAYLTKLGVYPNNRLVVARRFESAITDDLTSQKSEPIATLISWIDDSKDFLSIKYNEKWRDASEGTFKKVLNEIGNDVITSGSDNKGGIVGDLLSKGLNIVPLPGFTEGLQYEVFKKLGMSDLDSTKLPLGNPNLIRESARRDLVSADETGSGLNGKFNITMVVEYEQKFISGVDPTTVYYDIIANALAFGTSESVFQFRSDTGIGAGFKSFLDDLGSGDSSRLKSALVRFISGLTSAIRTTGSSILRSISEAAGKTAEEKKNDKENSSSESSTKLSGYLTGIALATIAGIVSKYKIRIVAVANSMTGTPSAPWHITIGNPKRPILSCGDMVCKGVTLTLGKVLSFNDLPSSVKLEIQFESARNLGLQEIFKKMSCGAGRKYQGVDGKGTDLNFLGKRKSFVESEPDITNSDLKSAAEINNKYVTEQGTLDTAEKARRASLKAKEDLDLNTPAPTINKK